MKDIEPNTHRTHIAPELILTPTQSTEPAWLPAPHVSTCACAGCAGRRRKAARLGLADFLADEDQRHQRFLRRFRR